MPEAYIIDAVRTAIGKRNGRWPRSTQSTWACTRSAGCSTGWTSIPAQSMT